MTPKNPPACNRTILELKLSPLTREGRYLISCNRTILELKHSYRIISSNHKALAIAPFWN